MNFEKIKIKIKVYWRFKDYHFYKVTKDKKIINSKTSKFLTQRIKGGSVGYYIDGNFIKRTDLNSHIEKIPTKQHCPFSGQEIK